MMMLMVCVFMVRFELQGWVDACLGRRVRLGVCRCIGGDAVVVDQSINAAELGEGVSKEFCAVVSRGDVGLEDGELLLVG